MPQSTNKCTYSYIFLWPQHSGPIVPRPSLEPKGTSDQANSPAIIEKDSLSELAGNADIYGTISNL